MEIFEGEKRGSKAPTVRGFACLRTECTAETERFDQELIRN